MKRMLSLCLTLVFMLTLTACGSGNTGSDDTAVENILVHNTASSETPETPGQASGGKILIAYFSATNNTENIANHLEAILGADLYEIIPEEPYTDADLDYGDSSSRSSVEMNDASARPAISGDVEDMSQYDTILLGYPIWWGEAPRIINTFLESYNLTGKTIAPFCTSASSPLGSSAELLQELTNGVTWLEGQRFSGSASQEDVQSWVDGLHLNG